VIKILSRNIIGTYLGHGWQSTRPVLKLRRRLSSTRCPRDCVRAVSPCAHVSLLTKTRASLRSILQSLASQSFNNALASPSTASTFQSVSEPAPAQTILTATLLLYLLREGPSPLPAVRTALAEKEGESDSTSGLGIKALYACVAKKLLKIDRKGREATVRFE
jgi:hypothetical protein